MIYHVDISGKHMPPHPGPPACAVSARRRYHPRVTTAGGSFDPTTPPSPPRSPTVHHGPARRASPAALRKVALGTSGVRRFGTAPVPSPDDHGRPVLRPHEAPVAPALSDGRLQPGPARLARGRPQGDAGHLGRVRCPSGAPARRQEHRRDGGCALPD